MGEETAVAVYRLGYPNWLLFAEIVAIAGFRLRMPELWMLFFFILIPPTVVARRRAIIFTPTSIIYRPAAASPRSVAFNEIGVIKKQTVSLAIGLLIVRVPGVAIQLRTGSVFAFPLDCKKGDEIYDRLAAQLTPSAASDQTR